VLAADVSAVVAAVAADVAAVAAEMRLEASILNNTKSNRC
jgi:hypothetical protein